MIYINYYLSESITIFYAMTYFKRYIDDDVKALLKNNCLVFLSGPKGCGKTTTAQKQALFTLDLSNSINREKFSILGANHSDLLLSDTSPILIDEWLHEPLILELAKKEIDDSAPCKQFILTSSISTDICHDDPFKIDSKDIAKLTMHTMSLFESNDSNGAVSLNSLFEKPKVFARSSLKIGDIAYLACRGGLPDTLNQDKDKALQIAKNYVEDLLNIQINTLKGRKKKIDTSRLALKALACFIGTQTSLSKIAKDISLSKKITDETLSTYLTALKKIYVVENSKAFVPYLKSKTAIRTTDTWYFNDPAIACVALGITPLNYLDDIGLFLRIFKNLCIRDLRVYAEVNGGTVYHYRDKTGLECDAVVALRNGKYGLIEIKLGGPKQVEEGAKNLNKLESLIDDTRMEKPSFKMVLTAIDDIAYQRQDKVYVVPIGCLSA